MAAPFVRDLRSGWVPAAACAAFGLWVLSRFETPAGDLFRYAAWLIYGIVVPGTLLWRALRGTAHSFVEDVAAGAALGYALEILIYMPLRFAGVPMLILLWPACVIGVFAKRPRLRRYWRSRAPARTPAGWSWAVAISLALIFAWMAFSFFRTQPLTGSVAAAPYVDVPYHLALAGEVKHHMPPTWPYVLGEPLHHHWFAQVDIAASSWATGIEMRLILLRLQLFPLLAVAVTLTAVTGSRMARRWWPGPMAVVASWFVSAFAPYYWTTADVFGDQRLLNAFQWQSPSSLVGAAVFAPVALLTIDRLRGEPYAAGQWTLLMIFLAAAMGAKSTLLPLFLAGVALAAVVELVRRRRVGPPAHVALIAGLFFMGLSTAMLYGAEPYGLEWNPLDYIRKIPLSNALRLEPPGAHTLPIRPVLAIGGLALIAWLVRLAPAAGLLSRRRAPDPAVPFLAGMVLAGLAAALLFTHPGSSQLYFLRSALPFMGVLAAAGLSSLAPREQRSGPIVALIATASAMGALTAWIAGLGRLSAPALGIDGTRAQVLVEAAKPMLATGAAFVAAAVALGIARTRTAGLRGMTAVMVVAAVAGAGLTPTVRETTRIISTIRNTGVEPKQIPSLNRTIPADAIAVARWLRDHSTPGEVVATNVHCRDFTGFGCENRHFWISAYTERRVLVEGWGYTGFAMKARNRFTYAPFRDPARLADNDRAFAVPSSSTIGLLRRRYGVTWLFVDERYNTPSADLASFASFLFRRGPFAVYRIPA